MWFRFIYLFSKIWNPSNKHFLQLLNHKRTVINSDIIKTLVPPGRPLSISCLADHGETRLEQNLSAVDLWTHTSLLLALWVSSRAAETSWSRFPGHPGNWGARLCCSVGLWVIENALPAFSSGSRSCWLKRRLCNFLCWHLYASFLSARL